VEDPEEVREFVVQALATRGVRVLQAADADQALNLSKRHSGSIDLLLTDVVLPGMNGRELAEQFRTLRPRIKVIYTSGYTQDIIASRGVLDRDVTYVHKPYSAEDIAGRVREAIDKR
jgi:two-component system cell cycle sensor histidine kinase/response regulator CckA